MLASIQTLIACLATLKQRCVGKLGFSGFSSNHGLGGPNYHARMFSGLTKHAQDYLYS